jgi:pSer/pThr/pTyr-binding forkhead associated (FHA) protein
MTQPNDETDIVLPPASADPVNTDTAADTGRGLEAAPEQGEPRLTAADHSTIEALNVGTALLLVQHGPTSGARFLLDAEVTTVGRHPGNDIFLDDVTVSRKHAQFLRTPSGFAVRDVGSLNGTYVGRQRIDGDVQLRTGDEVQVGKFRFLYQQSPQRSAQSPSPSPPAAGGGE